MTETCVVHNDLEREALHLLRSTLPVPSKGWRQGNRDSRVSGIHSFEGRLAQRDQGVRAIDLLV